MLSSWEWMDLIFYEGHPPPQDFSMYLGCASFTTSNTIFKCCCSNISDSVFPSMYSQQLRSFWPMRATLCPPAVVILQAAQWVEETWLASCFHCLAAMPGSRGESPWPLNNKKQMLVRIKGQFTQSEIKSIIIVSSHENIFLQFQISASMAIQQSSCCFHKVLLSTY